MLTLLRPLVVNQKISRVTGSLPLPLKVSHDMPCGLQPALLQVALHCAGKIVSGGRMPSLQLLHACIASLGAIPDGGE